MMRLIYVTSVRYVKLKNLELWEEKVVGDLNGNTV